MKKEDKGSMMRSYMGYLRRMTKDRESLMKDIAAWMADRMPGYAENVTLVNDDTVIITTPVRKICMSTDAKVFYKPGIIKYEELMHQYLYDVIHSYNEDMFKRFDREFCIFPPEFIISWKFVPEDENVHEAYFRLSFAGFITKAYILPLERFVDVFLDPTRELDNKASIKDFLRHLDAHDMERLRKSLASVSLSSEELSETAGHMELRPGDKVLVRCPERTSGQSDEYIWIWKVNIFSYEDDLHMDGRQARHRFICLDGAYTQCVRLNDKTACLAGTDMDIND